MSDEETISTARALGSIEARLAALDQKAEKAHARIDRVEGEIAADLKELRASVQATRDDINRAKGGISMLMVIATFLGGAASWAATTLFGRH